MFQHKHDVEKDLEKIQDSGMISQEEIKFLEFRNGWRVCMELKAIMASYRYRALCE